MPELAFALFMFVRGTVEVPRFYIRVIRPHYEVFIAGSVIRFFV